MIAYSRQHGDESRPGQDRPPGDRRDDGEARLPQHQGPRLRLSPRNVDLPRAEQGVRPRQHHRRRDDPPARGSAREKARHAGRVRRDARPSASCEDKRISEALAAGVKGRSQDRLGRRRAHRRRHHRSQERPDRDLRPHRATTRTSAGPTRTPPKCSRRRSPSPPSTISKKGQTSANHKPRRRRAQARRHRRARASRAADAQRPARSVAGTVDRRRLWPGDRGRRASVPAIEAARSDRRSRPKRSRPSARSSKPKPFAAPETVNAAELPRSRERTLDGPPLVTCKAWAIADAKTGEALYGDKADDEARHRQHDEDDDGLHRLQTRRGRSQGARRNRHLLRSGRQDDRFDRRRPRGRASDRWRTALRPDAPLGQRRRDRAGGTFRRRMLRATRRAEAAETTEHCGRIRRRDEPPGRDSSAWPTRTTKTRTA